MAWAKTPGISVDEFEQFSKNLQSDPNSSHAQNVSDAYVSNSTSLNTLMEDSLNITNDGNRTMIENIDSRDREREVQEREAQKRETCEHETRDREARNNEIRERAIRERENRDRENLNLNNLHNNFEALDQRPQEVRDSKLSSLERMFAKTIGENRRKDELMVTLLDKLGNNQTHSHNSHNARLEQGNCNN